MPMQAQRRGGRIAQTIRNAATEGGQYATLSGRFKPREYPSTHCKGGCLGLGAGLFRT